MVREFIMQYRSTVCYIGNNYITKLTLDSNENNKIIYK